MSRIRSVSFLSPVSTADSYAALRAFNPGRAGEVCIVRGGNEIGDGGQGLFYWDPSSTDADDGGVFTLASTTRVTDTGRWKRIPTSGGPGESPLVNPGDIYYHDAVADVPLPVGDIGQVLAVVDATGIGPMPVWQYLDNCLAVQDAFFEALPDGNPLPTSRIWWETAAKLKKIREQTITYSGAFESVEVTKYYADGVLKVTCTDTITYTGPVEKSRTRVVTYS